MKKFLLSAIMGLVLIGGAVAAPTSGPFNLETFWSFITNSLTATPPYSSTDYVPLVRGAQTMKIPGNFVGIGPVSVVNNTALAALSTANVVNGGVWRVDYGAGVGAPPLWFVPETGTCVANSRANDGGSCVNTTSGDGNSFYAVFDGAADFREWGVASGGNVDTALNSVITFACLSHTPIYIPNPANPYQLSVAHTIGNGSATHLSDCNKVTIEGDPQYPEQTSGTTPAQFMQFIWTGGSNIIPITVQGPLSTVNLKRIAIDCNNICATGFKLDNALDSEYGWLGVYSQVGVAYIFTTAGVATTWAGGFENNWVHDIFAAQPGTGGSGAQIGNVSCAASCATAVISDTFERMHILYDGNTAGTFGIRFGLATQIKLSDIQAVKLNGVGSQGDCLQIDASAGALAFPDDTLIDRIICDTNPNVSTGGVWAPTFGGGIHILHWSDVGHAAPTGTGVPTATGYEAIWGTDGQGHVFGAGPFNWTPVDASGGSLTLTNTGSTWTRTPHGCAVYINLTYPSTSDTNTTLVSGLPAVCAPSVTANVVAGFSTIIATPVSVMINNAAAFHFSALSNTPYTNANMTTSHIIADTTYSTVN